jgi:hypothetical protein
MHTLLLAHVLLLLLSVLHVDLWASSLLGTSRLLLLLLLLLLHILRMLQIATWVILW